MIEKTLDVPFIADQALHEKQIQQNYRPIIAVRKWFARRPGTLFRGLILSEFVDAPLRDAFCHSHSLKDIKGFVRTMGRNIPPQRVQVALSLKERFQAEKCAGTMKRSR